VSWSKLVPPSEALHADGRWPIAAYSEFMPGPPVGWKPYRGRDPLLLPPTDDDGFPVAEHEEALQLRPGLTRIAQHLCGVLRKLVDGQHALSKALLADNPYWPANLAERARERALAHPRHLVLLPLALSRTLDDKGRVRWTLFGSSEQGPSRPFWTGFHLGPDAELPEPEGRALLANLVAAACEIPIAELADLRAGGLRLIPVEPDPDFPSWSTEPIPRWARESLTLRDDEPLTGVRAILTFRPFSRLPENVQQGYLDGKLRLLPFPGSLVFFGHPGYRKLARELPHAMQIPLLHLFPGSHAAPTGMRIPQSGWLDEARARDDKRSYSHGPVVSHVKRTSRWNRTHRDEDETTALAVEDRVSRVLFSTDPEELGLYGKPMARNSQIWTADHRLLLDGPLHGRDRIEAAARALAAGGHYGYRFHFPPMRVGMHELYWQRPLCAVFHVDGEVAIDLLDGPTGVVTAYPRDARRLADPILLWPRIQRREDRLAAVELFGTEPGRRKHTTTSNVLKILNAHDLLGPLSPSLARRLLTCSRDQTLDGWLADLPDRAADPARGKKLSESLRGRVSDEDPRECEQSLTFSNTATRAFEERYFATIAELAEGQFVNKDNADRAGAPTAMHAARDLEALGDHLRAKYTALIAKHGMEGRATVGEHPFRWRTDFDFPWMGGWARNQLGHARERNVVVVIPGRERGSAVMMADHYDTAYMEDVYEKDRGGDLTRRAAAGADDNHSATAALLLAADVLLGMASRGELRRDVWLVHLTGEEFPADCLGARALAQRLVEGSFGIWSETSGYHDLSSVEVRGAYILDMVAHNNDRERYVFQISPGEGRRSSLLARFAHFANERWNRSVDGWNGSPERAQAGPAARMPNGAEPPPTVAHPHMEGQLRPGWHPASSLYNTDAQIFSDAGIPVVLFMENYDINRSGYHDTHDTMQNIDLDYGAALAAIAIESVAIAATSDEL
jgi:hypothetical protein